MPRGSRFERDRVKKLFGNNKTKLIQKPSQTQKLYIKSFQTPQKNKLSNIQPSTQQKSTFTVSRYIQMQKVSKINNKPAQIQKTSFRCYKDSDIFGEEQMINFLKQNHDNDHDTPQEQIKYDVNRGIKKLKQQLEKKLADNGQGVQPSQKGVSVGGTPRSFVGIRYKR